MTLRPAVFSSRALNYLKIKIISQMQTDIVITRPSAPTLNTTTGVMTAHTGSTVYTGKARVYPVSGGQQSQLGDGVIVLRTTSISIPETATAVRADDMVTITGSVDDTAEVNSQYRVLDVSMGGVGDPTRKLSCTDWEPNSYHTQS